MAGCFWYIKRRNKTEPAMTDGSPAKGLTTDTKNVNKNSNGFGMHQHNLVMDIQDEVWFDSRLVFDSDSDDDFKSVSGDSLPVSFGRAQSSSRPSFTSLKERMEDFLPLNGSPSGNHSSTPVQDPPAATEVKKTLGELFIHKPEEVKKPIENRSNQDVPITRQESNTGNSHDKIKQKCCFPLQPRLSCMWCLP